MVWPKGKVDMRENNQRHLEESREERKRNRLNMGNRLNLAKREAEAEQMGDGVGGVEGMEPDLMTQRREKRRGGEGEVGEEGERGQKSMVTRRKSS